MTKAKSGADRDAHIKAARVKSRLLGIEDAINAFSDESLIAENKALIDAIDEEMVSCHLGVFNPGDDPRKAINMLMCWAQGVGEYFALHPVGEDDKNAWLKTPMLSSTALTRRSERDTNAILANRRARLTTGPDQTRQLAAAEGLAKALEAIADGSCFKVDANGTCISDHMSTARAALAQYREAVK